MYFPTPAEETNNIDIIKEIKSHVYCKRQTANVKRQIQVDNFSIENKQIKTVQINSYG